MIVGHAYGPPLVGQYCRRVRVNKQRRGEHSSATHNRSNKQKGTREHNTQPKTKQKRNNVPILASPAFAAWMVQVFLPSPSVVVCPAADFPRVTKQTATVAPDDVTPRDFE